jgi:hypothetical protein
LRKVFDFPYFSSYIYSMEKITDANIIGNDAFNAGFEGRESNCMPARYADDGDNWRIWADQYQAGERDAHDDELAYRADAQSPDATGQNQWRQDEAVDLDYGYHSFHDM